MFDTHLIMICKIISTLIFSSVFVGFLVYAYWKPNREYVESLRYLPFEDEGEVHP
jgi:cbb3-type cytochrome oxidase subunit 3